jgi:hypothetical protein
MTWYTGQPAGAQCCRRTRALTGKLRLVHVWMCSSVCPRALKLNCTPQGKRVQILSAICRNRCSCGRFLGHLQHAVLCFLLSEGAVADEVITKRVLQRKLWGTALSSAYLWYTVHKNKSHNWVMWAALQCIHQAACRSSSHSASPTVVSSCILFYARAAQCAATPYAAMTSGWP